MRATVVALSTLAIAALVAGPAMAEVRTPDAPPAQPGGALTARGAYTLECWQNGTRVIADRGQGEVVLPTPAAGGAVQVQEAGGGRVLVLLDGQSLCRVVTRPAGER